MPRPHAPTSESETRGQGAGSGQGPLRTLVTGGAGFIGSHLSERLVARGDRVTIVDDLSTGRCENLTPIAAGIEFIEGDLAEVLPRLAHDAPFDEVYHLAAAVGVDLVLADPIGSIERNIGLTGDVLRFAESHGNPRVLVASSSEVYGKPGASVFSEDDDVHYGPTTTTRWSYACSKAIDEYLVLAYHEHRGLPAVAVRFFNTVGPRQIGRYGMVLPRFVAAALKGEPLRVFGDGLQTRCFCDVRDVADTLPRVLGEPSCHGRIFNLGSDTPISIIELAERVIAVLGSSSGLDKIPYDDAYPGGFEDLRHRRPDLSRVRDAVGFAPTRTLEDTIRDVAAQVRAEQTAEGARP
ncbi:MAG: UDP-glucose 4-epimerase [Phycisphaeraceae bacterium]|nr:MAG: UDP-glucose 4-epimerase [Phycisphaeraceae bacterium]